MLIFNNITVITKEEKLRINYLLFIIITINSFKSSNRQNRHRLHLVYLTPIGKEEGYYHFLF